MGTDAGIRPETGDKTDNNPNTDIRADPELLD